MLDLKIINGTIVDGSGAPGFRGDVGVRGGRIVAIGSVDEPAAQVIDAADQVVSPGFVDVHTHYDAQIRWDPTLSPSCLHGVTTVFGGFCGFSVAPLTDESKGYILRMLARVEGMPIKALQEGVAWDWRSFGEYLDGLEGKVAVNAGFLAGHSTIRRAVMGERAVGERATDADLAAMKALLAASLAEGALGFSSTVSPTHNDGEGMPVPSRHASREELIALAGVVRDHEGTVLELLPGVNFNQETYELLADYSLAGQRPVNWNMLAATGTSPDEVARATLQLGATDYARSKGAEVIALTLPTSPTLRLNFHTGFILDALPGWADIFRLPVSERLARLRDPECRRQLRDAARSDKAGLFEMFARWGEYTIAETFAPQNAKYAGRLVGDIAQDENKDPFDALIDIVVADDLRTSIMPRTNGEDLDTYRLRADFWNDDRTVVGASDAGAHNDMIDSFAFSTNFLSKAVREHEVISLEGAVHQLTQVPAALMGLKDRGLLKEGHYADLVVFDPRTVGCGPVHTRFDFPGGEPRLFATADGISHVIVNGCPIVREGAPTGATPGVVLRSGRDTYTVGVGSSGHAMSQAMLHLQSDHVA